MGRAQLAPAAPSGPTLRLVDVRLRVRCAVPAFASAGRGRNRRPASDGLGDPSGDAHRAVGRFASPLRGVPALSFLNPLFLLGLAAAAIPVIIHLFTRKRPREVPFSSLEFLTEVNRSEIRRIQLKQWLLLLLRALALAALALAMSRPVWRSAGGQRGASATVVALVDVSGSMGALTRSGTLVQEARRALESLISTLGPA